MGKKCFRKRTCSTAGGSRFESGLALQRRLTSTQPSLFFFGQAAARKKQLAYATGRTGWNAGRAIWRQWAAATGRAAPVRSRQSPQRRSLLQGETIQLLQRPFPRGVNRGEACTLLAAENMQISPLVLWAWVPGVFSPTPGGSGPQ